MSRSLSAEEILLQFLRRRQESLEGANNSHCNSAVPAFTSNVQVLQHLQHALAEHELQKLHLLLASNGLLSSPMNQQQFVDASQRQQLLELLQRNSILEPLMQSNAESDQILQPVMKTPPHMAMQSHFVEPTGGSSAIATQWPTLARNGDQMTSGVGSISATEALQSALGLQPTSQYWPLSQYQHLLQNMHNNHEQLGQNHHNHSFTEGHNHQQSSSQSNDDHASASQSQKEISSLDQLIKVEKFPEKLHRMLVEAEENGQSYIASFTPSGLAFQIHNPKAFEAEILRKYFRHSSMASFRRQLNIYGFERITTVPEKGAYRHEWFQRDRTNMLPFIQRKCSSSAAGFASSSVQSSDKELFPQKLYRLLHELEADGRENILSFISSGTAFRIGDRAAFVSEILPKYFHHNKFSSFRRQLSFYGFQRVALDDGAWYHSYFVQGKPELLSLIRRHV